MCIGNVLVRTRQKQLGDAVAVIASVTIRIAVLRSRHIRRRH